MTPFYNYVQTFFNAFFDPSNIPRHYAILFSESGELPLFTISFSATPRFTFASLRRFLKDFYTLPRAMTPFYSYVQFFFNALFDLRHCSRHDAILYEVSIRLLISSSFFTATSRVLFSSTPIFFVALLCLVAYYIAI